jgi:predicted PurR-regulated permease PerM
MPMELSQRQKNIVAAAITILSLVVILAAAGAFFWGIARFLRAFSHVFLPLAVAGVAALVFRPYFDWLRRKLRMPAWLALIALFLTALIPLTAFAWFFGALIAEQCAEMIDAFPEWWQRVRDQAEQRWPKVVEFMEGNPFGQRIRGAVEGREETLSKPLDGLDSNLPFLKPETRKDVVFLATQFVDIVVAFFRGQLIIAMLQGLLYAIGFTAVGLKFGLVLGLLLGFLNIIPYLGSIVGLGIALPLAYFQEGGGPWTVLAVLVVFTVVQLIESYVLTPKIMGSRTGLHPMAIIVAVFFWGSALSGILGMILAIPITAFLVVFWRLAREKYIDEWV